MPVKLLNRTLLELFFKKKKKNLYFLAREREREKIKKIKELARGKLISTQLNS